jgi:hypothetical protein
MKRGDGGWLRIEVVVPAREWKRVLIVSKVPAALVLASSSPALPFTHPPGSIRPAPSADIHLATPSHHKHPYQPPGPPPNRKEKESIVVRRSKESSIRRSRLRPRTRPSATSPRPRTRPRPCRTIAGRTGRPSRSPPSPSSRQRRRSPSGDR